MIFTPTDCQRAASAGKEGLRLGHGVGDQLGHQALQVLRKGSLLQVRFLSLLQIPIKHQNSFQALSTTASEKQDCHPEPRRRAPAQLSEGRASVAAGVHPAGQGVRLQVRHPGQLLISTM